MLASSPSMTDIDPIRPLGRVLSLCVCFTVLPAGCDQPGDAEGVFDSDGEEFEAHEDELEFRWATPLSNHPTLMTSMNADTYGGSNGGCWDTSSGGGSYGRPFQQYRCHGQDNQLWKFEPVSGGFLIHPKGDDGRCVDVPGFNFVNGQPLQTYPCNGGINQVWRVFNHDAQSATIRPSASTNLCIEVHDAVKTHQSPLQIGVCNGQSFQAWRFHDWIGKDTSLSCDWGWSMRFGPVVVSPGNRRSFAASGSHFNTLCSENLDSDGVSCSSSANWFVVDNPWGSNDWDVRCFQI